MLIKISAMDGSFNIFPIYKPKGPTSYDMVEKIKALTGEQKVGHAGTLDPLAEGVLVVGVGRKATRELENIVAKEKEYRVVIQLGQTSTTDDDEGEKKDIKIEVSPVARRVMTVVKKFVGDIEQIPPMFSAVKVGGKRAYDAARKGQPLNLEPRKVFIKEIQILRYEYPVLELRVTTGKGVYIRSLARDIGEKLGTGGFVSGLKRTRVGEFTLDKCLTLEKFADVWREMVNPHTNYNNSAKR